MMYLRRYEKPRVSIDRFFLFGGPDHFRVETENGVHVGIVFNNGNGSWSARAGSFPHENHGDWYISAWAAAKQLQLGTGIGVYRNG